MTTVCVVGRWIVDVTDIYVSMTTVCVGGSWCVDVYIACIKYIVCYKHIYRKCGHEVWIGEQVVYTYNNYISADDRMWIKRYLCICYCI